MRPALSIIVVTYRSRAEIGACLASLPREVAGGAVEVVVVDNSPGDGAGEIVIRDFPSVRYLAPGGNHGFGRANNLGFQESSGAIVLFLNPDTVANAGALAHCVHRLRTEADIGLISPKLVQADGSMDPACRRSIPTLWDGFCRASGLAAAFPRSAWFAGYNLTHLPEDGTYDVGAINGAFMMARRGMLEQVAEPRQGVSPEFARRTETARRGELRGQRSEAGGQTPEGASQKSEGRNRRSSVTGPLSVFKEPTGRSLSENPSSGGSALSCETRSQVFDERFFMYGDDLDLCIRVACAGYRIVYDGHVQVTHLKGMSVARDYDRMARAIFDANRDVYLKHFNPHGSRLVRWKYVAAFGLWKRVALSRARRRGHRSVRPL